MPTTTLPNGQVVNIDNQGNILDASGNIFTGGGAPLPATSAITPATLGAPASPNTNLGNSPNFLSDPNAWINNFMSSQSSGLSTSVNMEEQIRKNIEEQEAASRRLIESQYGEAIGQETEKGKKELGVATAQTARFAGGDLGLDTASAGYISSVKKDIDDRIKTLEKKKEQALAMLDVESIKLTNESLRIEEEKRDKINDKLYDRALKILGIGIDLEQLNIQKENAKIQQDENYFNVISKLPAGETYTSPNGTVYTGIATPDPFFKSSDLIAIAKELPEGETQTITDPNTGQEFTIQGMKSATEGYKVIQSTNAATGEVTLTTYDEVGNIVNQVSAGKIAKSKPNEAPSSYQEWSLAGGQAGTGKTYAQFLAGKGGGHANDAEAAGALSELIGGGGFVDINVYRDIKNLYIQNNQGTSADFDDSFSDYLSPEDRRKYGIGKTSGTANNEIG